MSKVTSLTIAIPAYNEEENITKSLRKANDEASKITPTYEILVIDDGSNDKTLEILNSSVQEFPKLRLIKHPKNLGIEATIANLYRLADKEFVFLNAADNEISMSILPLLVQKIEEGADIVVAQRKVKDYKPSRKLISWGYNFLPKLLFGVETYDAGCAKLIKADIYKNLKVQSTSVFAEAERLIRASRAGYKIVSVPVNHFPKKGESSFRLRHVFSSLRDLFLLFFELNFRT